VPNAIAKHYTRAIMGLSALLALLCIVMATSLYRQQVEILELQQQTVRALHAADALGESMIDLSFLLKDQVADVSILHSRIEQNLQEIPRENLSDSQQQLLAILQTSFKEYQQRFDRLPSPQTSGYEAAVSKTVQFLTENTIPACRTFQDLTDDRLDAAGASHALILRELAWGVAAVGVVGSLAGVMLGYVVALGVRRTIRRLQVQLRDTAGMILETQSEIVVTTEGPEQDLDTQIRLLTHEVGAVVARLRQRELEVLRSEQLAALGQLAAGVAHEIRNPLTSIKLLVQGAHGPQATSRLTSEDLSIVEQEVLRMENSLQTFLDFARPPRLERRRVDLGSLVAQTFELLRGRAAKQRVELRFTSPGAPLCREVDPVQLRQVLLNLALNSLDVLPSGGWLQFDLWSDPQGAAELQLCDNGPGISPEISGKLFQPFQSNKETGLGLGLVISRRIVEEHGGTLEQVPRPQGGACFRLRLPPTPEKPEHVVDPVGG